MTTNFTPLRNETTRVADESQLAGLYTLPGARVYVFPVTLEEMFVDWFNETAPVGTGSGDTLSQPG